MAKVRLHLDADASHRALHQALMARGHDITRTPTEWIAWDATDERQLLAATAQGRCLFTFNVRDFVPLVRLHPHHAGVLFAAQQSWSLGMLIGALDRFLTEIDAEAVAGNTLWLNAWRH